MLEDLHIENYAIIDKLSLDFSKGMNALTGETGAGKSILTGALSLLLGTTQNKSIVRNGSEFASVSATFFIHSIENALDWLKDNGIAPEDNRVIIRRVIRTNGKSTSFIQGTPVNIQQLKDFTSILIDMHGQHEHQSLFSIVFHRRYLDSFANCKELLRQVQSDYQFISEKMNELKSLREDKSKREYNIDLLKFALKEIDDCDIQMGEDTKLEEEQQKLLQFKQLFHYVDEAHTMLSNNSGLLNLRNTRQACKSIASIDASQKELSNRVESLYFEAEDIALQITHYKNMLNFDPQRLSIIEDRLAEITNLRKKYGPRVEDIFQYRSEAEEKLKKLEHAEDYTSELVQEIRSAEKLLLEHAQELSKKRTAAARKLEHVVQKSIAELGMPKSVFRVSITQKYNERKTPMYGPLGIDRIEFLLSANLGEPLKPLKEIASGGEISRVMLAIKNALAKNDEIPSLVFDEIDTGIGGEVARSLGEHLQKLSQSKQVFCITHLASIAVYAETQIRVSKSEEHGRTLTRAQPITSEDRVQEIARMLSGDAYSELSLQHAQELLETAKKSIYS